MKKIPLSKGKSALVDDLDYEGLSQFKWYAMKHRNTWYAVRDHGKKDARYQVRMHHLIVGAPLNGFETDHLNGDGLDNRRSNLKTVSRRQNHQNRWYHRNNTKLPGTTFDKRRNLWQSRIYLNGKNIFIGQYHSATQAHEAYMNYEKTIKSLNANNLE